MEMQKAFGRDLDAKVVMKGWEDKFAGRYSIEQLVFAIDQYSDKHQDFPSPSNIVDILDPEEPKVSTADFISAQKWQERNQNWSAYTDADDTIKDYNRQNKEEREIYKISCDKIKQLALTSVKTMDGLPHPDAIIEDKTTSETNEKGGITY